MTTDKGSVVIMGNGVCTPTCTDVTLDRVGSFQENRIDEADMEDYQFHWRPETDP